MIDITIHIIKLLKPSQTNDVYTLPLVACQMVLSRIIVFNKKKSDNIFCYILGI